MRVRVCRKSIDSLGGSGNVTATLSGITGAREHCGRVEIRQKRCGEGDRDRQRHRENTIGGTETDIETAVGAGSII